MKRTRRIEITTFSRRITLTQRGARASELRADAAPESQVIELVADVREAASPVSEDMRERQSAVAVESSALQLRRSPFNLRSWFRNL